LERILKSYELMLDFYGMVLVDRKTGQIARSSNYKERYYNLNTSGHNYLRITRILKCLGEMGFEHLKLPFLEFLVQEVYVNKELRNVKSSLGNYWSGTLRDDDQRAAFLAKIEEYDEKERAARGMGGGGGGGMGGGGRAYGAGGYGMGYRGMDRVAAEERYRRANDESDSSSDSEPGDAMDEDSSSSDEEGLTVAEKAKRRAAKARTVATAATTIPRQPRGNVAGEDETQDEEDEKEEKETKEEKTEERKEEKTEEKKEDMPSPGDFDARCNEGVADSQGFGNESVGTQELTNNNNDTVG